MSVPLPLAGVRVLDLGRALAGPFCSMILADLGCDVIKVEALPDGDLTRGWDPFDRGVSCFFLSVNRNKRSLAVDFRNPEGLALLRELAVQCDVVVENFKPGTMAAMDLSWEALSAANPRLVFASITGFGSEGPYGDWPGVDQIAQGMSGLMSLTGQKATGPTRVGIPVGDVAAGMWAAIGVQAALWQRRDTGRGQRVETSLLAALIGMLNVQGQRHLSLGDVPGVAGNDHPVIAPYGTFRAADGPFNLCAASDAAWRRLCGIIDAPELLADPAFADNTARLANRDRLRAALDARFATRPRAHWIAALVDAGLPAGPIHDLAGALGDPQVAANALVETIEHPELGPLRQLASPVKLEAFAAGSVRSPPPRLGEHSGDVLRDLGLAPGRIEALLASGVVR
jgi:crotonobetainyl-CoA:carnitine CoA-transferase CaiB-like acyl-CoA transferase